MSETPGSVSTVDVRRLGSQIAALAFSVSALVIAGYVNLGNVVAESPVLAGELLILASISNYAAAKCWNYTATRNPHGQSTADKCMYRGLYAFALAMLIIGLSIVLR